MRTYYLGCHQPGWLSRVNVPLFVCLNRLLDYATLPTARTSWALDSGGFTELSQHGRWRRHPGDYAVMVDRIDLQIGNLDWAAPMDWMCEPQVVAKTGLSVREHQERTVANFVELEWWWAQLQQGHRPINRRESPFMPVLQGWTIQDYVDCSVIYAQAGVRLENYPVVGLGSVCRRQATSEIEAIARTLGADLPLHGFGVKTDGLARYARFLASADSMSWSAAGRRRPGCHPGHASEANCLHFALRWRKNVLRAAGACAATSAQPDQMNKFRSRRAPIRRDAEATR